MNLPLRDSQVILIWRNKTLGKFFIFCAKHLLINHIWMYAYKSVRCTIVRKQRWWEKNGIFGNRSLAFVFSSRQFQCTYMWTFNWVVVDDTWLHGGWGIYRQYTHHGNHQYPNLELKRRPNFSLQYSWPWPEQFLDLRNQPINRNRHFHPATVFV